MWSATQQSPQLAPPHLVRLMDVDSMRAPVDADGAAANHMTMAAVALHCIGGDAEQVINFESEYIRTRHDRFPDASRHPTAQKDCCSEKRAFIERLGQKEAVFSVRDFFREEISTKGVFVVVQEFLSLMEPWLHHGQWLPLLRLASVAASGHPGARLFADGLAYLATKCANGEYSGTLENVGKCPPESAAAALPVAAASWELEDPAAIWAHLRAAQARSGPVDAWLTTQLRGVQKNDHPHEDVESVLSAQLLCSLPEITSWALGRTAGEPPAALSAGPLLPSLVAEMGRLAMRMFLTIPRGSTLHGFTVAQGVASLLGSGFVAPEQQARIASRFWVWLTSLYVEKGTPELVSLTTEGREAMASVGWHRLLPQVRTMIEHAHVIELAYSCHWFWLRADPDPLMKLAVVRALEAAHPWRADQPFQCERYLQATAGSEAFRAGNRARARAHVQELMSRGCGSWNAAWEQSTTPWDLGSANKVLVSCLDRVPARARCLVPGCGSGHDLLALANGQRSVCGLEISEVAGSIARRSAAGRSDIEVVVADFFAFSGAFDFIFDHTFFCALPPALRELWAQKTAELLQPRGLLLAVVWPLGLSAPDDTAGPPFRSSVELYYQLLTSKGMELEAMRTESVTDNLGQRTLATTWWRRSEQTPQDLMEISRVLGHWFHGEGGSHNPDHRRAGTSLTQVQFWMLTVDGDHDALIESEFKAMYESVRTDQAKLRRWMDTSKGCVALVLLLDQFTRHMFRGTSRMFESDDLAMEAAGHALRTYWAALVSPPPQADEAQRPFGWPLTWCEVWFLTLTWSHSERMSDHDVGIAHVVASIASMPQGSSGDASREHFEFVLLMAKKHRALLEKYGRYPHRNSVLGRQATELEVREWSPDDFFQRSVARAKAASQAAVAATPLRPAQCAAAAAAAVPRVLRLYLARYSANCLGPWLTLRWLQKHRGVRFELVDVDILNAEQMTPKYTSQNPNHTVPLLVDPCHGSEPMVVFESHAIMRYLARHFDAAAILDPPCSTAVGPSVCWALEFRLGRLYPALEKVTYPAMGFSQDFENVYEWKFVLESALRDFAAALLPDGRGLIGGSQVPTIADFAIAPCLHLMMATDVKPPQAVTAYLTRFMTACPDATTVAEGDGGFGIIDYINRRRELGHVKRAELREYRSPGPGLVLSPGRRLVLSSSVCCVESLPVRILMALLGSQGLAPSGLEFQGPCADPFSSEVPLFHSGRGVVVGGCNSVLRYLCEAYELQELYPRDLHTRADVDTTLDFCCTVLRRFLREALYPVSGLGGDPEKASQGRCRLPWAALILENMLSKAASGFLCSTSTPSIADLAVAPCLLFFRKLGLELSPALGQYLSRCRGHWRCSEELLVQVASAEPAPSMLPPAGTMVTKVDLLRASGDQDLHHKGSIADPLRMIIHEPLSQLPHSHREWDALAADLPMLVRNLQVRQRMDEMPVLEASAAALPDKFLARASSLLAIFAHCYWHNEFNNQPKTVPQSLMLPWVQVTKRLGRPVPAMTYEDLYTYNWRGVPRQVTTLRLATPSTGCVAEQRFYLGTVAISYAAAPVVELAARAARQCRLGDHAGLVLSLQQIRGCVKELDQTFRFLSLQRGSPGFVDPVLWTMTVATFAMSFVDQLGFPKAIAPSGNSLPILHFMDAIFGRDVYVSRLAKMTKSMLGQEVMAPQHRELVASLRELGLRDLVEASGSREAVAAWNSMIKAYIGDFGWLGAHRRKVFGFILVAAVVGRPSTLLNFGLNVHSFQKDAEEMNSLLLEEVAARQGTLVTKGNEDVAVAPAAVRPLQMESPPGAELDSKCGAGLLEVDLGSLCLHNHRDDLWVAISGKVFDLTAFAKLHPGGEHVLGYYAGLDATGAFMAVHSFVPLPMDLCVGVFVQNPKLEDQGSLASFLKQCTLFLNAAALEYHSILQHRCACDHYDEHGHQPMLWSPFNLMMLLRMYHKLLDQMLPCIIQEMAAFLGLLELGQIAEHAGLSAFKHTTTVPESLRSGSTAHMAFASEAISTAHSNMVTSVSELRALGLSWLRDGVSIVEDDVVAALSGCLEAVDSLVGDVYCDVNPVGDVYCDVNPVIHSRL